MSKPTETKRYVYHSKTWVPVGPQTREEGEEEAMLNELAEVKERICAGGLLSGDEGRLWAIPLAIPSSSSNWRVWMGSMERCDTSSCATTAHPQSGSRPRRNCYTGWVPWGKSVMPSSP